ncbi:MAG: ABC transporter substrate-binding protein [Lachnospiraceae bacterium]
MKKKLLGLLMMGTIGLTLLTGCGSSDSDTIKIGVAAPFTGDSSVYGDYTKKGVELAVEELNAAGGVLGKEIEVVYGDDKGSSTDAVSVAQKFATDDSIVGIVGHFFSSCTLAAGEVYQSNGIPEVAMASTAPGVLEIGDYVYRVNIGDNYQGGEMAKLLNEAGYQNAAVIYENTDYGTGVANAFVTEYEALGAGVAVNESYTSGSDDYSLLITEIKNSGADVLVIAGYDADAAKIMMQSKNQGITIPVYASDGVYTDTLIELGKESVEGMNIICYFSTEDPSESVQTYLNKLKEKEYEVDSWSAYCYDAMMLMADAIERAGTTDRDAVKEALANTTDFVGVTGAISFENSNEPASKDIIVVTVQDGEFVVK